MLTIKRILFPTDFSTCAESAFAQAAFLAERYGAELHVLHVEVEPQHHPAAELLDELLIDEQSAPAPTQPLLAQRYARSATAAPFLVHAHLEALSAADAILDYATEHDVDLIVMGTHGRRGMRRFWLGSVAEEVVRRSTCPVFTVRPPMLDKGAAPLERILVPVDFSDYTRLAITYARHLAEAYGASLDLLHVVEEAVLPHVYGIEPVAVSVADIQDRTREALKNLVSGLDLGLPAEAHVLIGHPALSIVQYAERTQPDLIVVATHGRTGFRRFLMGSVAEKVVRMAPAPVFTVKSFGRSLLPEEATLESGATAVER